MQSLRPFRSRYDAVIVGARCAGAATAFLLARAGAKVLLVDRQAYGSDTLSTHALMRTGVLQLHRWGLLPMVMAEGTPEIRCTTFHYGREALRLSIKPEHGVNYLCAPRRTVLDRVLVDAARKAGAEVRHGVFLTDIEFDSGGQAIGVRLRDTDASEYAVCCDLVVGADGRQSTVARLVNAEVYAEGYSSSAYVFGYFEGPHRDGFHWHFAEKVAAGVIPTNHGQHCVFASVPTETFAGIFRKNVESGFFRILEANSPNLREDVGRAHLVGRLRGFGGARGHLRKSHGPGWALVGDAGYFKDPLTAHGITDALRDAELLARAVLEGGPEALAAYQSERDALSRTLFDITEAIASFRWSLDEVKFLHTQLAASMKAEAEHVAGLSTPFSLAA
jgi:2-polyprenyl-6-methoxyphenol hydroxylase-like FAD-dependent oxidoreductase